MQVYIHELHLSGDDEFSKRFNYVSWLWMKYINAETEEEKEFYGNEHWSAKYCLEQGLPIGMLNEYN